MDIPAWLFITFWALISITFLHLGFHALEKTELSTSVSPLVMFLFKHSLAVSSCFSASYALKFRSQSRYAVRSSYVLLVYVFSSIAFRRTIEGILIWHVVKTLFSWLLYFAIKLKIFFEVILHAPTSLFLSIFPFLWKFLLTILLISAAVALYHVPLETILFFIYRFAVFVFGFAVTMLIQYINAYVLTCFFSSTEFLWIPILYFLGACIAVAFLLFLCVCVYNFLLHCIHNFSELKTRGGILLVLEISLFFLSKEKGHFSPVLALSISHFLCVFWSELSVKIRDYAIVSEGERFEGWMQIGMSVAAGKMREVLSMLNQNKARKFIEFAVGTVGAVLFQSFFKINSFGEVAAFLYLAVMWLGNLVLLGFSGDFGVFNFFLGNVVVGCTVGEFGLHRETWVALGAAFVLYGLRLKLESVPMAYAKGQRIYLSFFGDDEATTEL